MVIHSDLFSQLRGRWWFFLWLALAVAYALPVGWRAYDRLVEVTRKAREQLILEHRLWELHPEYHGTSQTWTRFASRLLNDRQLMLRVRAKYGESAAEQIELDYRRDLTIAQAEVVAVAAGLWALPVGALYGIGLAVAYLKRRRPRPAKTQPSSFSDPRYRN
jgi:hypothetical protein